MALPGEFVEVRVRARPMAPDERRAAILDATIPLLLEHGRDVSTKLIAEAAGVAEGTLFRAFGDKESLLRAAGERYFDPLPLRAALRGIDPEAPVEEKIEAVIALLRLRMDGVIRMMSALRMPPGPPPSRTASDRDGEDWIALLEEVFAADVDRLAVSVHDLAYVLRLLAFGASIPLFTRNHEFGTADLARLVTHGLLTPGAPSPSDPSKES